MVSGDPSDFISATNLWNYLRDIFGPEEADQKLIEAYDAGSVASVRVKRPFGEFRWPVSPNGIIWKSAEANDQAFRGGHELLLPNQDRRRVGFRWDGHRAYDFAFVKKTFEKGHTQRDIIDEVLRVMKDIDDIQEGDIRGLSNRKALRGLAVFELARDVMRGVADENGAVWGIVDRKLHHVPRTRADGPIDITPKWELLFSVRGAETTWPELRENEQVERGPKSKAGRKRVYDFEPLRTKFICILVEDHRLGAEPNFSKYATQLADWSANKFGEHLTPDEGTLRRKIPEWCQQFLDVQD